MEITSNFKHLPSTKSSEGSPTDLPHRYKTVKNFILDMSLQVGKGHFGEVYQAYQLADNQEKIARRFACKMISHCKEELDSEFKREYKRFENEVKILSQLQAPGVVQFVDAIKTQSSFYLFTELCNGGDLEKLLRMRTRINEEESRLILIELVKGVQKLHEKGILHRDLKLANVLVHFPEHDLWKLKKT